MKKRLWYFCELHTELMSFPFVSRSNEKMLAWEDTEMSKRIYYIAPSGVSQWMEHCGVRGMI